MMTRASVEALRRSDRLVMPEQRIGEQFRFLAALEMTLRVYSREWTSYVNGQAHVNGQPFASWDA